MTRILLAVKAIRGTLDGFLNKLAPDYCHSEPPVCGGEESIRTAALSAFTPGSASIRLAGKLETNLLVFLGHLAVDRDSSPPQTGGSE